MNIMAVVGSLFFTRIVICILIALPVLSAQELPGRDSFFKNNFATSGGITGEAPAPVATDEGNSNSVEGLAQAPPSESHKNTFGVVRGVSLLVSALDQAHVALVIEELQRILSTKALPLRNALIIGKTEETKRLTSLLSRYGIAFRVLPSVPVSIEVKRSPAWIFNNGEKALVLDGYLNPLRFMANDRTFVEPQNAPDN